MPSSSRRHNVNKVELQKAEKKRKEKQRKQEAVEREALQLEESRQREVEETIDRIHRQRRPPTHQERLIGAIYGCVILDGKHRRSKLDIAEAVNENTLFTPLIFETILSIIQACRFDQMDISKRCVEGAKFRHLSFKSLSKVGISKDLETHLEILETKAYEPPSTIFQLKVPERTQLIRDSVIPQALTIVLLLWQNPLVALEGAMTFCTTACVPQETRDVVRYLTMVLLGLMQGKPLGTVLSLGYTPDGIASTYFIQNPLLRSVEKTISTARNKPIALKTANSSTHTFTTLDTVICCLRSIDSFEAAVAIVDSLECNQNAVSSIVGLFTGIQYCFVDKKLVPCQRLVEIILVDIIGFSLSINSHSTLEKLSSFAMSRTLCHFLAVYRRSAAAMFSFQTKIQRTIEHLKQAIEIETDQMGCFPSVAAAIEELEELWLKLNAFFDEHFSLVVTDNQRFIKQLDILLPKYEAKLPEPLPQLGKSEHRSRQVEKKKPTKRKPKVPKVVIHPYIEYLKSYFNDLMSFRLKDLTRSFEIYQNNELWELRYDIMETIRENLSIVEQSEDEDVNLAAVVPTFSNKVSFNKLDGPIGIVLRSDHELQTILKLRSDFK